MFCYIKDLCLEELAEEEIDVDTLAVAPCCHEGMPLKLFGKMRLIKKAGFMGRLDEPIMRHLC
jgi:hypothetical protein